VAERPGQRQFTAGTIIGGLVFPCSTQPRKLFWTRVLNNGITILADECPVNGHKITITNPEIVNGLQTSHEIFAWHSGVKVNSDGRNILLRIIVSKDDKSRTKIIKATNSQTKVSELSLMSTDQIQEDIEDRLKLYGLFYDRKKGEYKRLKQPLKKIIGIGTMAQAFIATVLQKPDESRGRPESYVNKKPHEVFDVGLEKDIYVACILLDRQISEFLDNQNGISSDERRDIRYYVNTLIGLDHNISSKSAESIAQALEAWAKPIPIKRLEAAALQAREAYAALGASDKAAKSVAMRNRVLGLQEDNGTSKD